MGLKISHILVLSVVLISWTTQSDELMLKMFSFDFKSQSNPKNFHTYGASIRLRNKIKLIPAVANRFGAFFANQEYKSSGFDIDFVFKFNSPSRTSDGFVFWYMPDPPTFSQNSGRIHGVGKETRGLAVWLHRDDRGRWRLFGHYDPHGMEPLEQARVLPERSCTLVGGKVNLRLTYGKIMNLNNDN